MAFFVFKFFFWLFFIFKIFLAFFVLNFFFAFFIFRFFGFTFFLFCIFTSLSVCLKCIRISTSSKVDNSSCKCTCIDFALALIRILYICDTTFHVEVVRCALFSIYLVFDQTYLYRLSDDLSIRVQKIPSSYPFLCTYKILIFGSKELPPYFFYTCIVRLGGSTTTSNSKLVQTGFVGSLSHGRHG